MSDLPPAVARAYTGADEDAALVARAGSGEAGAFDALFRKHYARAYNLALRMDGNAASAEDIAQAAFVRAYRSLGSLRDGRAFVKFLYRIVVNLTRDRAKAARRKPWVSFHDLPRGVRGDAEEPAEFADRSLDPARTVVQGDFSRALTEHIAGLPVDFREVLVLHHIEGLNIDQIAEVVGAPVGTVKSRLGRARQRLRDAMRDWTDEEGRP